MMRRLRWIVSIAWLWTSPAVAATVTLAWDPPVDGLTTGYVVAYGTTSTVYETTIDVGFVTEATIEGLQEDSTYYFAVQAYAADGRVSGYSNEVAQAVSPPPPPVLTALALSANVPSPQQVGFYITWTASASGGVTPYQFQWSWAKNGGAWTLARAWDPAPLWTWAPSVGDYQIRVEARSAGGTAAELSQTMPFTIVKKCNGRNCR